MPDEINYENSIVCFLDILGFKEVVYSKDEYDKRRLKNYHDLANFILKETTKTEPKKTIKHLSDTFYNFVAKIFSCIEV